MSAPKFRPLRFGVTRVRPAPGRPACATCVPSRTWSLPCPHHRPPAALGLRRRPIAASSRGAKSGRRHAPATGAISATPGLGRRRAASARRCWTAACRRAAGADPERERLEHAHAGAGLPGMPACPTARCRRPTPSSARTSTSCAMCSRHADARPGVRRRRTRYAKAIAATVGGPEVEVVLAAAARARRHTRWADLLATEPTPRSDRDAGHRARTPSPSSCSPAARPKCPRRSSTPTACGAPTSSRCAQSMPVLGEEPPVLVDWLPWNHTFGGNHNVGMVLFQRRHALHRRRQTHAGADARDAAQPARDRPHGLLQRAHRLRGDRPRDEDGRRSCGKTLLSRARCSSTPAPRWPQSRVGQPARIAGKRIGERIVMVHRPGHDRVRALRPVRHQPEVKTGDLGLPTPGMELKLVHVDGKTEIRYRGPNVTPGYWRAPKRRTRPSTKKASSAPATP
jgi:feruloyl-CoA synthase